MDKLSKITAYVPVSVGEKLPITPTCHAIDGDDCIYTINSKRINGYNSWLEKRENVFVLTETELEKLLGDAFCAGEIHGQEVQRKDWYDKIKSPNKVQFINQLINPI